MVILCEIELFFIYHGEICLANISEKQLQIVNNNYYLSSKVKYSRKFEEFLLLLLCKWKQSDTQNITFRGGNSGVLKYFENINI